MSLMYSQYRGPQAPGSHSWLKASVGPRANPRAAPARDANLICLSSYHTDCESECSKNGPDRRGEQLGAHENLPVSQPYRANAGVATGTPTAVSASLFMRTPAPAPISTFCG